MTNQLQDLLIPYLDRLQTELKLLQEVDSRIKACHDNLNDYARNGYSQSQIESEQGRLATHERARASELAKLKELLRTVEDAKQQRYAEYQLTNAAFRQRLESVVHEAAAKI